MMEYDLVVLGGGPAGYVGAIRAAQLEATVALVERERIGGTCLNHGCIPTKALVESASLMHKLRRAEEFGILIEGKVEVAFSQVMRRKDAVVQRLVQSVRELLRAHRVEVISGEGSLLSPGRVLVRGDGGSTRELSCRRILIATGSRPSRLELEGHDLEGVVDSRQLLDLKEKPQSLVVVGASVVGMELATIFHGLGTKVSVLGRRTFLKSVDPQLARRYRALAARKGIGVEIGVTFERIEPLSGRGLRLHYRSGEQARQVDASMILLATGREPQTTGIGLPRVGVELDGGGFIPTDNGMRTNVSGVYAAGDVVPGWMLAHVASHEALVAVENALGRRRQIDYTAVPNCVFTDPEIATVGMTEAQAKASGLEAGVARFPLSANGRALTMGEEEGLVRLVYERDTGTILGVHLMGPHASELIAEGALAVKAGLKASDVADLMHQHPTLSENTMEAAMAAAFGEAIHYRRV